MAKKLECIFCGADMEYDEGFNEWECPDCEFVVDEYDIDNYRDMVENRMSTCDECGKRFNIDDAAADFEAEFNGLNYLDECKGHVCAKCLIEQYNRDVIE